jgi:hypothetical protein
MAEQPKPLDYQRTIREMQRRIAALEQLITRLQERLSSHTH